MAIELKIISREINRLDDCILLVINGNYKYQICPDTNNGTNDFGGKKPDIQGSLSYIENKLNELLVVDTIIHIDESMLELRSYLFLNNWKLTANRG